MKVEALFPVSAPSALLTAAPFHIMGPWKGDSGEEEAEWGLHLENSKLDSP